MIKPPHDHPGYCADCNADVHTCDRIGDGADLCCCCLGLDPLDACDICADSMDDAAVSDDEQAEWLAVRGGIGGAE